MGAPGEMKPSTPNPSRAGAPASWDLRGMAMCAAPSTHAGQATVAATTW